MGHFVLFGQKEKIDSSSLATGSGSGALLFRGPAILAEHFFVLSVIPSNYIVCLEFSCV